MKIITLLSYHISDKLIRMQGKLALFQFGSHLKVLQKPTLIKYATNILRVLFFMIRTKG